MLQKQCRDALNTLQRDAGKFRATPQAKVDACKVILDVTGFPGGVRAVKCSGVIAVLCKLLRDGYRNEKEAAADVLARLAAEEQCRAAVAEGGTIETLIHMLRPDNVSTSSSPSSRSSAALALANISSDAVYAGRVTELQGHVNLARLLQAKSPGERAAACMALGNMAVVPRLSALIGAHPLNPIASIVDILQTVLTVSVCVVVGVWVFRVLAHVCVC